ncbi:MAG: hypothetical protein K6E32_01210 [Lachnospiraceae bacterium]|nr:hypothetical protein [Lachnospiraceae bacterium]
MIRRQRSMNKKMRRALMWICLLIALIGIVMIAISMFNEGNTFLMIGMACVVVGQIINFVLNIRKGKDDDK